MSIEIRPDEMELHWADQFADINKSIEVAEFLIRKISDLFTDYVQPGHIIQTQFRLEVLQILNNLNEELQKIKEVNNNLDNYFVIRPWEKWKKGDRLTEDEFHLLWATGVFNGQIDYETFMYHYYEDDIRKCYLFPLAPIGLGICIEPEEVKMSFLREDQRKYFEQNWPEFFARFNRE